MLNHTRVGVLEIEYDEVGTGGRPFVMVHGSTGSSDDFADVLEPIGALGRTLVPDLRGHGGTTNPGVGYSLDPVIFDELLRDVMNQQPVSDRLREIRCPTLILVGDQDESFLEPSREMADGIPDATLVVIKDSHHSPQIEARDAWLAAISAHLGSAGV